ncbi:MAG: DNA polymerase/3'-5' exonuclease PolX [Ignavibacteriales bacterium]|nr:DNA polymerase/3'-5' exonuclease PolX [Ignavibacteriales bacterium]
MSFKNEIISILENISDLLEFKGENPFKISAFRNGANAIRSIEGEIETKVEDNSIKNVKGIGKGILSVISDYYKNGKSSNLENLLTEIPEGIFDLLKIRGLGAKKVKLIYNELGITKIDELNIACQENKISGIKGFGIKTQEAIIKEIKRLTSAKGFILLNETEVQIDKVLKNLTGIEHVLKIEPTGDIRRHLEIISKLEFVILVSDLNEFQKLITNLYSNSEFISVKDNYPQNDLDYDKFICLKIIFDDTIPVILFCTENSFDFNLLLFLSTGSNQFLELVTDKKYSNRDSEELIFKENNIAYIIPEMREQQFFQLAQNKKKNSDLSLEAFRGFFHFHTNYSDGKNNLTEMATSLKSKGYKYLAVCDHSKSAIYANGLNENRIFEQKNEIEQVSKEMNIRIFHGIESDILGNGDLDYSLDFLHNFDFIVASIHSQFQMNEVDMTNRIIKAIENPYTDVLGHPTGRLLLKRDGYKLNITKVIDACAANKVAIEINAHPQRLDLDWRNIFYAREKDCLFSINPDAHSIEDIDLIKYGIMVARKGGICNDEVINCYEQNKFISFIQRKVKRNIQF